VFIEYANVSMVIFIIIIKLSYLYIKNIDLSKQNTASTDIVEINKTLDISAWNRNLSLQCQQNITKDNQTEEPSLFTCNIPFYI